MNEVITVFELSKKEKKEVVENFDNHRGGGKFPPPPKTQIELSKEEFENLRWKFSTTKLVKTKVFKAFTEKDLYMLATNICRLKRCKIVKMKGL